jgi:hypothetical protein
MKLTPEWRVRLLTAFLFCSASACNKEAPIEPGEDLFSVLEEIVLEVALRAPKKQAIAKRGTLQQPLSYTFESRTGKLRRRHCGARPELDRAAAMTYEITVRDVVAASEADEFLARHRHGWTTLEVRSSMDDGEPFRLEILPNAKRPERAYARYPRDGRLFLIDSAVMRLADMECPSP